MRLPSKLRNAIEQEISHHGLRDLIEAAAELSEQYRSQQLPTTRHIKTRAHRLAYIAVRMPATFAACHAVFTEIRKIMPTLHIESLLDLGAGPGTAAWAATDNFKEISHAVLLEQDEGMIEIGRGFASESGVDALQSAKWIRRDLQESIPESDLVICSYSLGELGRGKAKDVLSAAWIAARKAIVIIEPGTMAGFKLVRDLRGMLIDAGGYMIAPCPHQNDCPMDDDDWCHFAQRFERSSLHRKIKSGSLGYEDEKFSYIAFSKSQMEPAKSRVIRHPIKAPGLIQIQLCAADGLKSAKLTRRDRERWKRGRKVEWGDSWGKEER